MRVKRLFFSVFSIAIATAFTAEPEFSGGGGHVCYDYKTVDPRFPVKWCTFNGDHQWVMRENGKLWASDICWEIITQF